MGFRIAQQYRKVTLCGAGLYLVIALAALQACATGSVIKDKLQMALYKFNSSLRWARHKQAAEWMVGKAHTRYLDRVEELDEDLKVSEVELLRVTLRKKGKLAIVRYRYRWHTPQEMILRKGVIVQFWKWKGNNWKLYKIRQASGPPFPYFETPTGKKKKKTARTAPRPAAS